MLDREEYIEQSHLFRALAERLEEGIAVQESLVSIGQEVLATSKLPMAIDYLVAELKLVGTLSTAMARMPHYFTRFQTFIMAQAEREEGRFDMRTALALLSREAGYRAEGASPQGLFFYRFESLSRNRLDYGHGLVAVADDDKAAMRPRTALGIDRDISGDKEGSSAIKDDGTDGMDTVRSCCWCCCPGSE